MKIVYADNAATTKVRQEVIDVMDECNEYYGNPSMTNAMGRKSKELIEQSRQIIADHVNAKPYEIIFTSSGTESNSLALIGFCESYKYKCCHVVTTLVEHASVLEPMKHLQSLGVRVTYLTVDNQGRIDLNELERSIRNDTILVSIMAAQNEIGNIYPLVEIGDICKYYNVKFHTDAVSAFGHLDIDVADLGIGMMSISGHKIYGPKGVGVLYAKDNIRLLPMIRGSGQEYGLRSGTENVNSIVGMGKAVELLKESDTAHILTLKNKLIAGIKEKVPNVKFNGSTENSLCNIVNISFDGIDGNSLLMMLSAKGIYASGGSPYLPDRSKLSHVMAAIGVKNNPVRFSLGRYSTPNDIDCILDVLPNLVKEASNPV